MQLIEHNAECGGARRYAQRQSQQVGASQALQAGCGWSSGHSRAPFVVNQTISTFDHRPT